MDYLLHFGLLLALNFIRNVASENVLMSVEKRYDSNPSLITKYGHNIRMVKKRSTDDNSIGTDIQVSEKHKKLILEAHNNERSSVDPPAVAMNYITWDDDLAELASQYSRKCIYKHNEEREVKRFGTSVGENIYVSSGIPFTTSYGPSSVNAWIDEKNDYDYHNNTCRPEKICGHYTQVVWQETFKVGCGAASCPKIEVKWNNSVEIWTNAILFICNYGPNGNYARQPYISGNSCSGCRTNRACHNKLCKNALRDMSNGGAINATWLEWSEWSLCSKTCEGGLQSRTRECSSLYTGDCEGFSKEAKYCNIGSCMHDWGNWSTCDCETGRTFRIGKCKPGIVACKDKRTEAICRIRPTCSEWSQWEVAVNCTQSCGNGSREVGRYCEDEYCNKTESRREPCNELPCDSGVSNLPLWSNWTECSRTCGGGIQSRTRNCSFPYDTDDCGTELRTCNNHTFPVYGLWGEWTSCSVTCGIGMQARQRDCIEGTPEDCEAEQGMYETKICSEKPCVRLEVEGIEDVNKTKLTNKSRDTHRNLFILFVAFFFVLLSL